MLPHSIFRMTSLFLVLTGLWMHPFLASQVCVKTYDAAVGIGPEIYYAERAKEGGAKQNGTLYGVRISFDYVKRYKFYWGADGLWAKGTIKGHVENAHLKSDLEDANIEGRFGYTFQSKTWRCASFTPFFGLGYFWENNHYRHPSPLELHFDTHFCYVPIGFLSQLFVTPCWAIGVNFKIRVLVDGKQTVSHDPQFNDHSLHFQEKLQYRVELPITHFFNWNCARLAAAFVPFYEYRPYGHRANFPFDFLETKFKFYGATLKLLYLF